MKTRVVAPDKDPRSLAIRRLTIVRTTQNLVTRCVLPLERTVYRINRVKIGVRGADENGAIQDERRRFNRSLGFERPLLFARREIDCVDDPGIIANEDSPLG